LTTGNYVSSYHAQFERQPERDVSDLQMRHIVERSKECLPYDRLVSDHGGTCWRIKGMDSNGRRLAIGVETYVDEQNKAMVVATVIVENIKRGRR
jgi:hypothetical protein